MDHNKGYKEGFKEGFREGWEAALRQTKRFDYPVMPSVNERCGVCGRSGDQLTICNYPSCPTRAIGKAI